MPDIAQLRTVLRNKEIDADDNTITDIDNNEIKAAAAIDYSKLNLAGSIVNADLAIAAAVAYSKLALTNSIVDADIAASGITTRSKLPSPLVYTDAANTYGAFDQIFKSSTIKIRNPADTFSYTILGAGITADKTVTIPATTNNDTFMLLSTIQTIISAKRFNNVTLRQWNPAGTFEYIVNSSALTASRNITLPLLTADDAFVFENHIQNMNNKTFLSSGLKLRNPADTFDFILAAGAITANSTVTLPNTAATSDTFILAGATNQTITGSKRFHSDQLKVWNPAVTFLYSIRAAAITANRITSFPLLTGDDTFAMESHAATLSNKALGSGTSVIDGQNIALGATTGTKIGTETTQKLGFFNATPVTQRTNIADVDAGTVNSGDATTDTVINDMRTKLNGILTRLEELGFFAAS